MLYKALNADFKSTIDDQCGTPSEVWVVDEWHEITGLLKWDPNNNTPRNGLFCSDDILWSMYGEFVSYIAAAEVDGESIIQGKTQCWQKMRVVSIKAWPPAKSALVLDWAEGRAHDAWASWFPTEATLYATKQYQGQWAQMLSVIVPVYQSLFVVAPSEGQFYNKNLHRFATAYAQIQEPIIRLAYAVALARTETISFRCAAGWVKIAEDIRPGSWEIVRGFAEDYWASLEELS